MEPLRPTEIRETGTAGLGRYVWRADEPALAGRLVGWCADGILTDRPGLVRDRVGRL